MVRDYNRPKESSYFDQTFNVPGSGTNGGIIEVEIPESTSVFVDKLQLLGSGTGDLSIAFGDAQGSPFILLTPDFFLRCATFGKVRLKNTNIAARSVHLIFSSDSDFFCYSSGSLR